MKNIIIGVSGKQGSGKTTLAKILWSQFRAFGGDVHHLKFADPLYAMQDAIQEVMLSYGREIKTPDGKLLQLLGTEWGRTVLGPDIWAELLKDRIKSIEAKRISMFPNIVAPSVFIVDDMRFPNEFNVLKEMGAITVRLEANEEARKARAEKWRDNTNHPSETSLDRNHAFDLVIRTDEYPAPVVAEKVLELVKVPNETI